MKTIFTFLALILSLSAFAVEGQYVTCNVGIEGDRYVELEYFFPTATTVQSYIIQDGLKIPTPNSIEIGDQELIVTSHVGLSDVKTITVPVPTELLTPEEGSFWIVPAIADDRDVWAACAN